MNEVINEVISNPMFLWLVFGLILCTVGYFLAVILSQPTTREHVDDAPDLGVTRRYSTDKKEQYIP